MVEQSDCVALFPQHNLKSHVTTGVEDMGVEDLGSTILAQRCTNQGITILLAKSVRHKITKAYV